MAAGTPPQLSATLKPAEPCTPQIEYNLNTVQKGLDYIQKQGHINNMMQ